MDKCIEYLSTKRKGFPSCYVLSHLLRKHMVKNILWYMWRQLSKKTPMCKNTERCHLWAFNIFKEWIKFHASNDKRKPADIYIEADLYSENPQKVCAMMCEFITEARQQNGEHYSPITLLQLPTNLQSCTLVQNSIHVVSRMGDTLCFGHSVMR